MTQCQNDNLLDILTTFQKEMPPKYEKGTQEHGDGCLTNLTPLELCEHALEEALDMVAFLVTQRRKLLGAK